jgi:flagellar hook-length control protein FliK
LNSVDFSQSTPSKNDRTGGSDSPPERAASRDRPATPAASDRSDDESARAATSPSSKNGTEEKCAAKEDSKAEKTDGGSAQEKEAVKDKKKTKADRPESEAEVNALAKPGKDAEKLTSVQAGQGAQQANDNAEKTEKALSVDAAATMELSKNAAKDGSVQNDSAAKNINVAQTALNAAIAQPVREFPEHAIDAQKNPGGPENAAEGKESADAKKAGETAAGSKKTARKADAANAKAREASVPAQISEKSTNGTEAGTQSASRQSAAPQAVANVLPAVLDAVITEKIQNQPEAANIRADTPTNVAMPSPATATARESVPAAAPANADPSTQVDRTKFVQRVQRAFAAVGEREGSVRLKLSPPELGSLKLEISVQKGVMKARVEAETPAAKSLLLDNLPDLRERLAQQNIHIRQFDVDLMDRSPGGMSRQTAGQSDSGAQQGGRQSLPSNRADGGAAVAPAVTAASQRPDMGGSVNVIV